MLITLSTFSLINDLLEGMKPRLGVMKREQKLSAKLSNEQCKEILYLWKIGNSFTAIGKMFHVHCKTISMICHPDYAKICHQKTMKWIASNYSKERQRKHLFKTKMRQLEIDPDRYNNYSRNHRKKYLKKIREYQKLWVRNKRLKLKTS